MSDSDLTRVEQYVLDLFRPQEYNGQKCSALKIGWFETCKRDPPVDNRLYWSIPTMTREYGIFSETKTAYADADSYVEKWVMLQLVKCLRVPHIGYVIAVVQEIPSSPPWLIDFAGCQTPLYFNKDGECFVFMFDDPTDDDSVYPGFKRLYIRE